MSYSTKHKMVLQSIMWSKCLPKNDLIEVLKKLQINENQLDIYVSTINSNIDKFNMSIARGMDGQTGDVYYALICISENRISKLSSLYSVEQLEVLKAALELIITKEDGRFKAKKIVEIMLKKNVKLTIQEIYNVIDEFVKEKYFQQIGDHFYIQPRGLIEFNIYFRTYYKDFVKECTLCKQIAVRGLKCKHCSASYHKICAGRFADQQDKCISCNNALELEDAPSESIRSSESVGSSQPMETSSESESEDDDL